jgi:hypothetical protein
MAAVDVIRRRGRQVIVNRPRAPVVTNGFLVDADPQRFKLTVVEQPLSGEELRNLDPGQNALDWRNVWADGELALRDTLELADGIYTVQRLLPWIEGKFTHAQVARAVDELPPA